MIVALLLAAAVPDPACAMREASVRAEDTQLAYVRCGAGAPTIVFEGGFGGNLANWATMMPMVARFAPVFAYSRPGFGSSTTLWRGDADGMRTSEESARLLHTALRAAKVPPPYVLVGHSLGGLYIQKFAQLFPRETAGLVLMDNRPATLMRDCAKLGVPDCVNNAPSPDWSPVLRSTFAGIAPSEAVAPTPESLGKLPVLLLTAGTPEDGLDPHFFDLFREAQGAFAKRLRNGRQVLIPAATHSSLSKAQVEPVAAEIRTFWMRLARP